MYYCQYCNKECVSKQSKVSHQRFCKLNPNYQKNKQIARQAAFKGHKTKNNISLQIINQYSFKCIKCGKQYSLELKVIDYIKGNYRKTCSNACAHANAINLSEQSKKKKSENLKKQHIHICPQCNSKFSHKGTSSNTLCPQCYLIYFKHTRPTAIIKNKNKNLNQKRHNICKLCGKQYIFDKTDKSNNHATRTFCCKQHYLQWRSNRKKYEPEYCKKLSESAKRAMAEGKMKPWQSRNIKSYAQKFFHKVLSFNKISYQYEVPESGYFLDFVIKTSNGIIDLQIDGKQHWCDESRKQSDKIRDQKLTAIGYIVYRIPWNSLNTKNGKTIMKQKIQDFLNFFNQLNNM